uniref:Secreted protein n=1 Tax=Ditylenchus dipsaci TaxID=166011 RepID=A0A915DJH8_9BILA
MFRLCCFFFIKSGNGKEVSTTANSIDSLAVTETYAPDYSSSAAPALRECLSGSETKGLGGESGFLRSAGDHVKEPCQKDATSLL